MKSCVIWLSRKKFHNTDKQIGDKPGNDSVADMLHSI